jgi:alkylhydroperoxidase family enzyme
MHISRGGEPMPITRMLELSELDPALREAAQKWGAQGGNVNMHRVFGQMPDFFRKFVEFYGPLVNHGRVPLRVKELARLRVANLNECHY